MGIVELALSLFPELVRSLPLALSMFSLTSVEGDVRVLLLDDGPCVAVISVRLDFCLFEDDGIEDHP